jgi:hypothetical protein
VTARAWFLTSGGDWRELGWVEESSLTLEPIVEMEPMPPWPLKPFSMEFSLTRPRSKRRRRERRRLFALFSGGIVRPLCIDGREYRRRQKARVRRRR